MQREMSDDRFDCSDNDLSQSDDRTIYTASDAMVCKYSCVSLGYYEDNFIKVLFSKNYLRVGNPLPGDGRIPLAAASSARGFSSSPSTSSSSSSGSAAPPSTLPLRLPSSPQGAPSFAIRKPPIINRGYHTRMTCIDAVIRKFLGETAVPPHSVPTSVFEAGLPSSSASGGRKRQIISLGCGFDTLAMRLAAEGHTDLEIYEVDFDRVIAKKSYVVLTEPLLRDTLLGGESALSPAVGGKLLSDYAVGTKAFKINNLYMLAVDLRKSSEVISGLTDIGLDVNAPTLIITECVLVYIEKEFSERLCRAFSSHLTDAAWVTYDMINPHDAFGKIMQSNLRAASFSVPGFTDFPTLHDQVRRFKEDSGWTDSKSISMLSAYNKLISPDDKQRIARIEIFDEIEEWELLMAHYCVTLAVVGERLASLLTLL